MIMALSRFGSEILENSSMVDPVMDTGIREGMKEGFFIVDVGE